MKIEKIGSLKTIMDNPDSQHRYFGWPSVARLQNGKIAAVASGYRRRHVCPLGKAVIAYSEDNGETYTRPAAVIDTPLDDRDAGITPFGEKGVIVTSFTNTRAFQHNERLADAYDHAYLDTVSDEEEAQYLGATYRFSRDGGTTWEKELYISPITSPHGPCVLRSGKLLWVGRTFSKDDSKQADDHIAAYELDPADGSMIHLGRIPATKLPDGGGALDCEPHAIELPNGDILCHIRVQRYGAGGVFTVYQSRSCDGGRTWSQPEQLLADFGGSPPHLMIHSSGMLICSYGYRAAPYGIRVAVSHDNGETWDTDHILWADGPNDDLGYPATIELDDGSLLTVFYAHETSEGPAVIMQQKWRMVE